MKFDERFFQIEKEWHVAHLPERPNGFAILIIGDQNHFVDENTSLWMQNPERRHMIEMFRNNGYLLFYSNLYGRHWGSPKAIRLLQQLYQIILRQEILNPKMHIIAEGMGALAALQLMKEIPTCIRSVSMLSPCIDLKAYFQTVKSNILFYKRFIHELAYAYQITPTQVEEKIIQAYDLRHFTSSIPVKIWHATSGVPYDISEHSRKYENIRRKNGNPISLLIHLYEQRYAITANILSFLKEHEKQL